MPPEPHVIAAARRWLAAFGHDRTRISQAGAELFAAVLVYCTHLRERVGELEVMEDDGR